MRREVHFDAPAEGARRSPLRLSGATVREGHLGDWSVLVWTRSEAEAVELAAMLNERLGRKPEAAEGVEP
jgi:hypothetical protein